MIVPGSPEWHAKKAKMLEEESKHPETWWYISFAEPGKFLGAVVVWARGFVSASDLAWKLGINPGGSSQSTEIGPVLPPNFPGSYTHVLLSKEDLDYLESVILEKPAS